MRISQLEGRRVALWGWGREARAAWRALRSRLPDLELTAIVSEAEANEIAALADPLLQAATTADADALSKFDVVVKSPGISPYRSEVEQAKANGTVFTSGTALWFAERPDARVIAITGTKGKSTTTALIAHLLRAEGHRTALAGNIGLPLLELLEPPLAPECWAIELSSYQTRDVAASGARPDVAVGLNVYPEHLDWHGSHARYVDDKLALFTQARPRIAVLNALDPALAALNLPESSVHWFNAEQGWHLRDGYVCRGADRVIEATAVPLPGRHNGWNLCAALTAIEVLGIDTHSLVAHVQDFVPLPHRLQTLGMRDGIVFVNDSISTTPHASIAALDCHAGEAVAIIVGGFDRGIDWSPFVECMRTRPVRAVVTMGQNGPRIHAALQALAETGSLQLHAARDMDDAVGIARTALPQGGTVLLSPGAPSFGAYVDYAARGRDFATKAGFDPDAISRIPGLGVA
ncbi:MAG: UDP-N-acetylmuramoyl-L-alanine--D-glutamate ligase [Proteobacteria bacterium]|nr:UDP-N-acetylmuramoyl-L-alanine--D-glutamate ligase [Pseudomonadota bacterium]